jgi:hypothetical protein
MLAPVFAHAEPQCKPPIIPNAPSKRPARGWLSRCEPMITNGAPGLHSKSANMLPMPSTRTAHPCWFPRSANQLRVRPSSEVAAWRSTPLPLVTPNSSYVVKVFQESFVGHADAPHCAADHTLICRPLADLYWPSGGRNRNVAVVTLCCPSHERLWKAPRNLLREHGR